MATIGDLVVNHEAGAAGCPEFTPKTNRYPNGRLADRARFEPMVAVRCLTLDVDERPCLVP